jgi:hypothetical protein
LLMIYANFYKILVPPSMIGLLLSFKHIYWDTKACPE